VTRHGVLSAGARWSENIAARTGSISATANAGTNGTPTPATGTPMTFGPDFTSGATGRGGVTIGMLQQYSIFENLSTYLKYRHDDGKWRIEASVNYSEAETLLNPDSAGPHGFFANVNASLTVPVRISFTGIGPHGPSDIRAFDNSNREVDLYDIRNYRLNTATEDRRRLINTSRYANLDVRRRLQWFSFPTALQVGGLRRVHTMDRWNPRDADWTPAASNTSAAPYAYQVYVRQEGYARWPFPGVYPNKIWEAFYNDRSLFTQTPAQIAAVEVARLNTSQYAEQTVNAWYVQGEARFLDNKLNLLTGVRYEGTEVGGQGVLIDPTAVFARNPDGSFVRNAQGARVRRADAGAAGSLQEVLLTRTERGYKTARDYDGFYPSVHLTYNFRENFQGRLAYAKTYGRPDFPDVIPSATIREADLGERELADPNVIKGDITVTNTGLKPWTAHNFDLSLEYYTTQGGVFSAGVFHKEIADFFGNEVRVATAADLEQVGLDPSYVGWNLNSLFNSGDARISGVEFNVRQSLRSLGGWGRYFTVFANATKLELKGNPHAAFDQFLPKTANWGFTFNWKRFTLMPKWNYRGLNRFTAAPGFAPDAYQYIEASTILDLNASFRLTPRLSLTASVNNFFNRQRVRLRYGAETPAYARYFQFYDYGAIFSVGIKGSF
jgi:TonB-dependent receptor